MAETTGITWCDSTFNPWRGCTKVSPGCSSCYAETMSGRNPKTLGVWGPNGTRVVAAESYWRQPLKWDREAKAAGERRRVFCASLADVFEGWQGPVADAAGHTLYRGDGAADWHTEGPPYERLTLDDVRRRLFTLIDATPNLDWLLLTKRPENIARMMPPRRGREPIFPGMPGRLGEPQPCVITGPRPNVWLGVSVEDQQRAEERHRLLMDCPAFVRFWSAEPLLGPIDAGCIWDRYGKPDWVIVGGESGHGARPCHVEWVRSLVRQCKVAGVACFVKQLGSNPTWTHYSGKPLVPTEQPYCATSHTMRDGIQTLTRLRDKKGGDINEFPADLRVREFPDVPRN